MFTSPTSVEVKCKRCGKPTPSNEFTLDPVYRMMVCRKCVAERHLKENPVNTMRSVAVKPQSSPAVRPVGLPPAQRPVGSVPVANKPQTSSVQKSSDKMKQKCKKCGFSFLYDAAKGYPLNCPNCSHPTQGGKYEFF